jgi:hypothetical protein
MADDVMIYIKRFEKVDKFDELMSGVVPVKYLVAINQFMSSILMKITKDFVNILSLNNKLESLN